MNLKCRIRIDRVNANEVAFMVLAGFETPSYVMPQIRNAIRQAEPAIGRIEYDTDARTGVYRVGGAQASVAVGQEFDLPILTYLHPPKTADQIVAVLERDPANLVINFYSGDAFETGWIQPEDMDDTSPLCEMIDSEHKSEVGKLLTTGGLAFDQSGILRLASVVKNPMSRAAYEKEYGLAEAIGWAA